MFYIFVLIGLVHSTTIHISCEDGDFAYEAKCTFVERGTYVLEYLAVDVTRVKFNKLTDSCVRPPNHVQELIIRNSFYDTFSPCQHVESDIDVMVKMEDQELETRCQARNKATSSTGSLANLLTTHDLSPNYSPNLATTHGSDLSPGSPTNLHTTRDSDSSPSSPTNLHTTHDSDLSPSSPTNLPTTSVEDYLDGNTISPYYSFIGVLFVVVTILVLWLKYKKHYRKIICCKPNSTRGLPVISHPIYTSSISRDVELTELSTHYLEPSRNMVYNDTVESIYEDVH